MRILPRVRHPARAVMENAFGEQFGQRGIEPSKLSKMITSAAELGFVSEDGHEAARTSATTGLGVEQPK